MEPFLKAFAKVAPRSLSSSVLALRESPVVDTTAIRRALARAPLPPRWRFAGGAPSAPGSLYRAARADRSRAEQRLWGGVWPEGGGKGERIARARRSLPLRKIAIDAMSNYRLT